MATMYDKFMNYVAENDHVPISDFRFKTHDSFTYILEHVSNEKGAEYLALIETEFREIHEKNIQEFVTINDKYGCPNVYHYRMKSGKNIIASPTTLRYIYHALLILKHYQATQSTQSMVEVGCGYGGLFLAICYYSKCLNIVIGGGYYMIDFPQVGRLIHKYLKAHEETINNIHYQIHDCSKYGNDMENNLFFISNYCFTEISEEVRQKYITLLFPKVQHGFIIWQTVFQVPIYKTNTLLKTIWNVEEERPQTTSQEYKNYFVRF